MKQAGVLLIVALVAFGCQARAAGAAPDARPAAGEQHLRQSASVPLPGVEGRFDHFAVDVEGRRLFVAALGNDTVEAIDLARNERAGSIQGLRKPTGIAVIPELKRIAVASGDDGMCRFYDAATLKLLGAVKDLDDADNVRYDAKSGRVYVGYGGGALAVVDAKQMTKLAAIPLPAHPESFRLETEGPRIFVNLPDAKNAVAVVDRDRREVVATWHLKGAGANFPMWLDEPNRRLFVGCRKPAKVLVLDTDSGRTVAAVDCAGDADDLFFDAHSRRIYVSGGDGAISVLEQKSADEYREVGRVRTAPGARTSLFVPEMSRLYLAVPRRANQQAGIRVYSVGGGATDR